ncbi:MAG: ribonuclease J, partial [Halanaerobiaceae bacterium]|nr:ribonuclease J [Halanaerobiaceae bacterium]
SIIPGDTVYLSSSPIPGNEKAIGDTINQLYSLGAEVIYNGMLDIHASGHACQEEIKLMINLTKPKYLIPVHGEFRHLYHHARIAQQVGIPVENILIALNGDMIKFNGDTGQISGKIETGELYIEGNQISDTGAIVLNDRKRLSENGFVNVIIAMNSTGELLESPLLISRGFVYNKESEELLEKAKKQVINTIERQKQRNQKDNSLLKKKVYEALNKYFYETASRSPLILVEILELPASNPV